MKNNIKKAIQTILDSEKLSKKLINLENENLIYNFFKEIDSTISQEDFREFLKELMTENNKVEDGNLEIISGGVKNKFLSRAVASSLALLSLSSAPINTSTFAINNRNGLFNLTDQQKMILNWVQRSF